MNMSYCRFENTNIALWDCSYVLQAIQNGEPDDLSRSEKVARLELIMLCKEIVDEYYEEYCSDGYNTDVDKTETNKGE